MAAATPLSIGAVALGDVPRVAVPFSDRETPEAIAALRRRGLDVAELRVDLCGDPAPAAVLARLDAFAGLPVLATIRLAAEGGGWRGDERARLALFEALLPRVDAVDVELAAEILPDVLAAARARGRLAIASHHDFSKTPGRDELCDLIARAEAAGADVVKIATTARDAADVRALGAVLAAHPRRNLIAHCMGEAGIATRVAFAALGSLLTYAHGGAATAPGQLAFDEMAAILRRLFPAYDAAKRREGAAPERA